MQAAHLELGREAEEAALRYFLRHEPDAKLVERNCRFRLGEIDLIIELPGELHGKMAQSELVFVEVRARSAGGLAKGFETLGPEKRARLKRAIRLFLARYRGQARTARVDVLSWDSGEWTWLKNVWL